MPYTPEPRMLSLIQIRKYLNRRTVNMAEIARRAGLSRQYVSYTAMGHISNPRYDKVARLSEVILGEIDYSKSIPSSDSSTSGKSSSSDR